MLVESATERAILLAHVDFELAGGAAALPAVVGITHAEVLFRGSEREPAFGQKLDVQESKQ